jgi:hypothetical protein
MLDLLDMLIFLAAPVKTVQCLNQGLEQLRGDLESRGQSRHLDLVWFITNLFHFSSSYLLILHVAMWFEKLCAAFVQRKMTAVKMTGMKTLWEVGMVMQGFWDFASCTNFYF